MAISFGVKTGISSSLLSSYTQVLCNNSSLLIEDGDRLFIIIPKQAAWLGGMVDLVEKENAGLKLTEAQIAELEKEFLATFETFTVVLSLSKK